MASPADAVAQANGLVDPSLAAAAQPPSDPDPSQIAGPTAKRKRETTDDGFHQDLDIPSDAKPITNGDHTYRDEKSLIRDYYHVLQRYDTTPSVLKRPLPDPSDADEPDSKRQKSDQDSVKQTCIHDKVNQDAYKLLDHLVLDLKRVIEDRTVQMQSGESTDDAKYDEKALLELYTLKEMALELHNREMAYPEPAPLAANNGLNDLNDVVQKPANGNTVLTIYGNAPIGKHLFSSLQKRDSTDGAATGDVKSLTDVSLPTGISITTVLPTATQKPSRVQTLGELFPSPANLPPLEAPKASKTSTKSKVLGFYRPEMVERSSYRHDKDSYFAKELSTGVWLDYSNAAPPNKKSKDRQRERTLSLAGQKPSTVDIEINEMEALFRGAFSSFAPSKDDSGAVLSSGEVARVWYQRQGHRYLQQMIDAELAEEAVDDAAAAITITASDEQAIANAVENWDDSLLDPSLTAETESSKKSEEEKAVDDTLQDISDLIETLSSYQRNRHLTLPTSQNRSSTDPAKADMLSGSLAQEPSDEERETYQMLKDQLAIIIQTLPPYAVARLNSDKLEELNVSTKIEVRGEIYRGVLEEDETSARARHQQQASVQATQTPRQAQRAPSFHSATPYQPNQQFNRQYPVQNHQTPVPVPNQYQQSPVRPQVPPSYQRQVSAPMPGMQPQQHRPPPGQPFARPTGWNPSQPMQPVRSFNTPGATVSQYQGSPGQPRMSSAYQPQAQPGTPSRFPQGYGSYTPQQSQPNMPQQSQQQYHQQHGNYAPHMNGVSSIQQRTMSPQVSSQYSAAQNYAARPGQQTGMPRGQPYGTPGQPSGHSAGIPRFPSNGVHSGQPQQSPAPSGGNWAGQMSPQQRYEHQMQARLQAAGRMNQLNEKIQQNHHAVSGNHHSVAGLGSIGLGGAPVDYSKLAQMRANMHGGVGQSSPSPRLPGASASPAGMNGMPQHVPSPSPGPMAGASPSPAPSANMPNKPPTPA